ncbi:SDR family oxidoreductase, partial [Bacillus cereus]|uniref:SDR family oxidoreductase n=1 Tax=Bacillus cereus TaxID=1396 RepID=UPI00211D4198
MSYKKTDVSKFNEVKSLIDYALEIHGHIDVLYNNAGIMPQGFLREGNLKSYQEMIDINVMGVLNGITAVLPTMRSQKDGLIISTDSVAGHVVY